MIGLCGAQRVGKSTLAQAFAKQQDIPFVQTSTAAAFKMTGRDPRIEYPIEERIAMQDVILTVLEAQYVDATKRTKLWIADRTPIDMAAYMLADIQRSTLVGKPPELAGLVLSYVERCFEAANRHFSTIMLVQPGIPPSEKEGSAPWEPGFMEHHNTLCLGLLADERLRCRDFQLARRYTDLDKRVQSLEHAVMNAIVSHQEHMTINDPGFH